MQRAGLCRENSMEARRFEHQSEPARMAERRLLLLKAKRARCLTSKRGAYESAEKRAAR